MKLYFPGYEGIPFRSQELPLIRTKQERPEEVWDAKIAILNLSVEADLKEYENICDMVAKGYYIISKELIEYDADIKNWRVFIRYLERFAERPGELQKRITK